MPDLLQFLLKYGYVVIFGAAFAEQIGLPLPAVPLLVGMGALSRSGAFSFPIVVLTGLIGSLAADLIWFELGWFHGRSVLRLICRISLEPDYCVRRTEDAFERLGLWALLLAKFVPGLNAAAVPLAGMVKTPLFRFLVFDVALALRELPPSRFQLLAQRCAFALQARQAGLEVLVRLFGLRDLRSAFFQLGLALLEQGFQPARFLGVARRRRLQFLLR